MLFKVLEPVGYGWACRTLRSEAKAVERARKLCGRVVEINGTSNRAVADFTEVRRFAAVSRVARAEAALFR